MGILEFPYRVTLCYGLCKVCIFAPPFCAYNHKTKTKKYAQHFRRFFG